MIKAHTMWLFTNRNCMIFDEDGNQMTEYQNAISCNSIDKKRALEITNKAEKFVLSKWSSHEFFHITRKEMQYLLGIRTHEMDLKDLKEKT